MERLYSNPPSKAPPLVSPEFDAEVLDFLHRNSAEFEVVSASTASNLIGPGRTLGRAIGALGDVFEDLCSKVGQKMGMGPHAATARLLQYLSTPHTAEEQSGVGFSDTCDACEYCAILRAGGSGPSDVAVYLNNMVRLAVLDRKSDDSTDILRKIEKECKRLVKYTSCGRVQSQTAAVFYVQILRTLFPSLDAFFTKHSRQEDLQQAITQIGILQSFEGMGKPVLPGFHCPPIDSTAEVLSWVRHYIVYEKEVESKATDSELALVDSPQHSRLMECLTALVNQFLTGDLEISHIASRPIMKTFDQCPPWLQGYVQYHTNLFMQVFNRCRVRKWGVIHTSDANPLKRALARQMIKALVRVMDAPLTGDPRVFENFWLALSGITYDRSDPSLREEMKGLDSLLAQRLRHLPFTLTPELDTMFSAVIPDLPRHIEAPCSEMDWVPWRMLGRFMHEWGARPMSDHEEDYPLWFPFAIPRAELHILCSQMAQVILQRCRENSSVPVPKEFSLILKKDKDVFDTLFHLLRTKARSDRNLRLLKDLCKVFSAVSNFRVVVSVPLHKKDELPNFEVRRLDKFLCPINATPFWRYWYPPENQYKFRAGSIPQYDCQRLIGNCQVLRWTPAADLRRQPDCYRPIVGRLDCARNREYIGLIRRLGHAHGYHPDMFVVDAEFRLSEEGQALWDKLAAGGEKLRLYVLAARVTSADENPRLYWASLSWCACLSSRCVRAE